MAKKRRKKKQHRFFWFIIKLQVVFIVLVIAAVGFYYLGGYGKKVSDMQADAKTKVRQSNEETFRSSETSLVYGADGTLISTLKGEKDVYYLEYAEIPEYAKAAIVSMEDKKFFSHNGIDIRGILRAARAVLTDRKLSQGGSTITQQLARGIFLTQQKTWERKVEEIFIAVELEKIYSKEKILEYYLNNIYFGNGYYGVQAASKGYFNKDIETLNLSQIAFLCAIPNNPTKYDPIENLDATIQRRDRILDSMLADGKISNSTYREALAEEIVLMRPEKSKNDYVETYTYYCATRVLMELQGFKFQTEFKNEQEKEAYEERYDEAYSQCQQSLYHNGYRIYISIDLEMQQQLQDSVDQTLAEYEEVNEEGVYALQGSAVCIDNYTGLVKAIVGGRNQNLAGYTLNRAYQSFRQPGSAIKPLIVYTPILERGYSPDTIVVDEPIEDGPKNSNGTYEGSMTLRRAVQKSRNTIAWKLFEELTPKTGLSYLKNMNFAKLRDEDEQLASSLGGFTTGSSALEMASAYAAIQNDGNYRTPSCITRITNAEGEELYAAPMEEKNIYQQNAARMMTDILKDVVVDGTGRGLGISSMASAGKTGTTNDNKDGWFVGYTRYYTTSVWVGYDMPRELTGLTGSSYPGRIWNAFMETIHESLAPLEFLPYIRLNKEIASPQEETPETEMPEPEEPVEDAETVPPETNPPTVVDPTKDLPTEDTPKQDDVPPPQEETKPDEGVVPEDNNSPKEPEKEDKNEDKNKDKNEDKKEYEDRDIM